MGVARRIGFVGLGRMGSRIAANLVGGGHELTVWNRTRATSDRWVADHGGRAAEDVGDLARSSEILITMLADGDALMDVYRAGLADAIVDGTLAIDMGTSGPNAFRAVEAMVLERGGVMVDAPVSGATAAAEAASLLVMVGAAADVYSEVAPVLASVGRPVNVGPTGSACVLKLAVNSVLYGINQALAEAVVLAEHAGVAAATAIDVLAAGAAGAPMIAYRREQYLHPDTAPTMFTLDLALKDLSLAVELAHASGVAMPQTERTLEVTRAVADRGYGDRDMGFVLEANRRSSGQERPATST